MVRRNLFYFALLCGAVGVPYFATESKNLGRFFNATPTTAAADPNAANTGAAPADTPWAATAKPPSAPPAPQPIAPLAPPVLSDTMRPLPDGPAVVDMAEALNFNVSAAWVLGRWPRVTACLPAEGLHGYRVPLVSGTQEDDVAGSLTYYFNNRQLCQRITLQATTGDARRLVTLVTKRFGLVQRTSDDPGLYLYQLRWNGQAISELHIRPAPVIKATSPNARFEILLALNNPAAT